MVKQRQKNKIFDVSYRRLDREKESGSDSGEETELYIKSKPQRKELPTIEKDINDGDTLQSIAIRYQCKIADLKRLNNIHKENEIYARKTIKVPIRLFTMAGIHISGTSSPDSASQASTSNLIDMDSLSCKLTDTLLVVPNGKNYEVNEIIFNSNIIQKPCDNLSEPIIGECSEDMHLLHKSIQQRLQEETVVSRLDCSGVDGDMSWIALFICIVIVIFAIPIIYVFYIAEHPPHHILSHNVTGS